MTSSNLRFLRFLREEKLFSRELANQIPVAVGVVDAGDVREVLVLNVALHREAGLFAGEGEVPLVGHQHLGGVRRVADDVVAFLGLAVLDVLDFLADLAHRVDEAVKFGDRLDSQRQLINQTQDRVRDTYYKRAAVVGFRAGMLAWFLYGEKTTRTYRKNTVLFATWVANYMLTQHLLRYPTDSTTSNINRWEAVYRSLGDEFSRDELRNVLSANNSTTPVKKVIQQWRMLGCIETLETAPAANGKLQAVRFRKK